MTLIYNTGDRSMDIEKIYNDMKSFLPENQLLMHEPMKNHTSFKIGGEADILVSPATEDQIIEVIRYCSDMNVPIFVMGNGSNLLVSDKGIRGVVLKIAGSFSNVDIAEDRMNVETGILLSSLANRALKESLSGLEFASGIPGTLGGALAMNAGAYGSEMKDVVVSITAVDMQGNMIELEGDMLEFGYRTSRLQRKGLIALKTILELEKGDPSRIKETMVELTRRRREKQPLSYPSGGSVFKRPEGYYAGKLIQDAGLKGYSIGGAQVSTQHAGFIINKGDATCADVVSLIETIKDKVYREFGVKLSPELKIVGEE